MGSSERAGAWLALMTEFILLLQADLDIQTAFGRYEDHQEGRGEVFMRQRRSDESCLVKLFMFGPSLRLEA